MGAVNPVVVIVSDTAELKAQVAKVQKSGSERSEDKLVKEKDRSLDAERPYGRDGMLLSKSDQYNPYATLLPSPEKEKIDLPLKKKEESQKEEDEEEMSEEEREKRREEEKKKERKKMPWWYLYKAEEENP